MQKEFIVYVSARGDRQADYGTIGEAIKALPKEEDIPATIKIAPGIYHEKLELRRANVRIEGEGDTPEDTVITYDDYGFYRFPDGSKRGTFRSYTFLVFTHDVHLKNLTIANPSAPSVEKGQAIALYAEGNHIFAQNCHILGHQDTLFVGPLPEKEYEPKGFLGPTEHAPRINGYQCYKDCTISGDIDFIFGSGTAFFENCRIVSEPRLDSEGNLLEDQGYVTAPSTPEGQPYGFVFHNCEFTGSCPEASVYLGRPWRDYGRCVLIDCKLGAHIHPRGFHDWGKTHAHGTLFFGEYGSVGAGAKGDRADFVTRLQPEEISAYREENVKNSVKSQ